MQIEMLDIKKLIPYARNSRTHSNSQVMQIAASIREFGFTNPVLIDEKDNIIAGHGRVLAAEKVPMQEVPCIRLTHLSEAQIKAYRIIDNKLALNAGWNDDLLKLDLLELKDKFNFQMDLMGFTKSELDNLLLEDNLYSKKIDIPQYEITGEKPKISDLINTEKTTKLIEEINKSKLPDTEKKFLKQAAARHYVFNYSKIAEYYAHADKELQQLMENSALVIIDFKDAIKNGYVILYDKIMQMMGEDKEQNGE